MSLDAAAYPHILDRIITYAPYTALIALRGTSRAVRTRADAQLLAGHVVVRCESNSKPWTLRLPAFRNWKGRAPVLACTVVDLVGYPASKFLSMSAGLPTVRYMCTASTQDRAFRPPSIANGDLWLDFDIDTFVYFLPLPLIFHRLPRPGRRPLARLVRNISVHPGDTFLGPQNAAMELLPLLEESVWVFHPAPADAPPQAVSTWYNPSHHSFATAAMLRRAFERVRDEAATGASVTVVGLDALAPVQVKKREMAPDRLLAKVLRAHVARVEVCSLDTYCKRVGTRRAAEETVMGR